MRKQINNKKNIQRPFLSLVEIGIVILSGFVTSYVMKVTNFKFFALPHLVFLLVAVLLRSVIGKWSLSDWGFSGNFRQQIRMGVLMWVVIQAYYAIGHLFAPLFPTTAKMGATIFNVTTLSDLRDTIVSIAVFKAGTLETLRYFAYAEGLLMRAFGAPLGAVMSFIYFGSAHMGIMNLIVLPVSFLFVYFYRTYKLIVPLIIFHVLGDAGAFTQNYFSFHGMYARNYVIFFLMLIILFLFRSDIAAILSNIKQTVLDDIAWLRKHKVKAILLSLVLPLWLHFLLYMENHI